MVNSFIFFSFCQNRFDLFYGKICFDGYFFNQNQNVNQNQKLKTVRTQYSIFDFDFD